MGADGEGIRWSGGGGGGVGTRTQMQGAGKSRWGENKKRSCRRSRRHFIMTSHSRWIEGSDCQVLRSIVLPSPSVFIQ